MYVCIRGEDDGCKLNLNRYAFKLREDMEIFEEDGEKDKDHGWELERDDAIPERNDG